MRLQVLLLMAAHCYPGITTLHVPAHEIGRRAATVLLDMIKKQPGPEHVRIDLQLIVRGTTAPLADSPQARVGAGGETRAPQPT